ncbi:OVARIAN TUMOR DOMAIN-containing deubiquitinating enzyme 1-like isoform X1 [Typha angustifolia]|uniref:OVARIAN TUMOR DOMAIN-containing deubiquitinating enzyme 1-like isoform X1 n=1 Tax=Typha angustifolia TaxID=59011 RepID=UPI003C2CA1FD
MARNQKKNPRDAATEIEEDGKRVRIQIDEIDEITGEKEGEEDSSEIDGRDAIVRPDGKKSLFRDGDIDASVVEERVASYLSMLHLAEFAYDDVTQQPTSCIADEQTEIRRMEEKARKKQLELETEMEFLWSDDDDDDDEEEDDESKKPHAREEGEEDPSSVLDLSLKKAKGKKVVFDEEAMVDNSVDANGEVIEHSWAASLLLGLGNCDGSTRQQMALLEEEAKKMPCLGDKEPVSALATDFPSDCSIIQEKIKLLDKEYSSFRRARRDGNCFYRSFIFSYLEQVVEMQDDNEVYRILGILDQFRQANQNQRQTVNTFDDFYSDFTDLMVNIMEWKQISTSFGHKQLLQKSQDENYASKMLAFFRLITSIEICARAEHFKPFLPDMKYNTLEEFCRAEVIPMRIEADHVQIIALASALRVSMRVVKIDSSSSLSRSGSIEVNQQDLFLNHNTNTSNPLASSNTETSDYGLASTPKLISSDSGIDEVPPTDIGTAACGPSASRSVENNGASSSSSSSQQVPFVTLLYRPGHYDILYPK